MLPVVDRPMIERVVEKLGSCGVTEAILSLGYRPDAFIEAYPDGRIAGVELHYAVEPEPLDTAGAVRFAALDAGIDSRFIVVNGDVLTDLDVTALWALHLDRGAEGTVALTPVDDPSRYGVVPIDANGRVEAFIEKPPAHEAPSHWINAGTYVLEPSVIARIPDGRKVSIEREIFPAMVADGSLYALQAEDYWVDAGTPETYLQVQLDLIDGTRGEPLQAVADDATVSETATVERSVVMSGAVIESGATVRDSLIMSGAVVEPGATVIGSIVGPRATIGGDATLTEMTVIGEGVMIQPSADLKAARVPEQ
jgi:mannose-1-phosphate guanylyltransferase